MELKHIIHPTDFSKAAMPALEYAANIAHKSGAAIHLVHVYEHPYVNAYYEGAMAALVDKSIDEEVQEALDKKLTKLSADERLKGLDLDAHLVADKPVWKFYEDENLPKGDLCVLGTTGHTGLLHGGLLGTNSARVIRNAPMPVISVPSKAEVGQLPSKIMYCTDFSDESLKSFGQAAKFAEFFGATIRLVTISTPVEFFASQFCYEEAERLRKRYSNVVIDFDLHNAYSFEEGVRQLIERHDVDLVSMYTEGRSGFRSFFQKKSETEQLAKHLATPELALKNTYNLG